MGVINQWERIHALCALGSILLEWTFDKKKGTDPKLEGKGECEKSFKFFSSRESVRTQIVQEGGGLVWYPIRISWYFAFYANTKVVRHSLWVVERGSSCWQGNLCLNVPSMALDYGPTMALDRTLFQQYLSTFPQWEKNEGLWESIVATNRFPI